MSVGVAPEAAEKEPVSCYQRRRLFMGKEKEHDELEGVESISPEQARKEMKQAAERVRKEGQGAKSSQGEEDELADVEKISPEQAKEEMREAVRKLKKEKQ